MKKIFTLLCMVLLVVGLSACGKPSLEKVVKDPEFIEQFDSATKGFESQGMKVDISAEGDVFRYDFSSDQLTQSHAEMLKQTLESEFMVTQFENIASQVKENVSNKTVKVLLVYKDGQGNEIASKEYTAP